MVQVNNPELYQRVNVFLGKDVKNWTHIQTIKELLNIAENERKEIATLKAREISYIDDIEQVDAMLRQANERINELENKQINKAIIVK